MRGYVLASVLFLVGCSDIRAGGELDASTKKPVVDNTYRAKIYCLDGVQYWAIASDRSVSLAVRLDRTGKVVVCD